MYEAILAEKKDSIQREIQRLACAIHEMQGRDNTTVALMLDEQLQRYLIMYQKLCRYTSIESSIQPE